MTFADRGEGLFARLSRISSSGRYIPEIDGLRFVAIASVVLFHLSCFAVHQTKIVPRDPVYLVASIGSFGVPLFFVISGFILSLPFAERRLEGREGVPLGRYYGRRLTRLEPPYIINILIVFGAKLFLERLQGPDSWSHLLATLGYAHLLAYGTASPISVVTWSLEIEVQFYLVAPILAGLFAVRHPTTRRLLLVGAVFASAVFNHVFRAILVPNTLLNFLEYFLLGFLLTEWYLSFGRDDSPRSFAWDLAGAVAWIALGVGLTQGVTTRFLLLPAILVAYVAAFRGRLSNAAFCRREIITIGGMCYTIYLYHFQFITMWGRLTWWAWSGDRPFWLNYMIQAALICIPLLIVSALLFALFERPFMRPGWYRRDEARPVIAPGGESFRQSPP